MTTINDIDKINAEAMMTLSEIGFAAYERYRDKLLKADKGSIFKMRLRSWLSDRARTERELELRIKVAPMYKAMA